MLQISFSRLIFCFVSALLLLPSNSKAQLWHFADSINRNSYDDYPTGSICIESGNFIIVSSGGPLSHPYNVSKLDKVGNVITQLEVPATLNNIHYLALESVVSYGKDSFILAGVASNLSIGNGYTFTKLILFVIDTALTGYRYEILDIDYPDTFNMNGFVKYKWLNGRCYAIIIANTPDTSEFGAGNQRNFYVEILPNLKSIKRLFFDRIGHLGTDLEAIEGSGFFASKGNSLVFNTFTKNTPSIVRLDSNFNIVDTNGYEYPIFDPLPDDKTPFIVIFNPVKVLRKNKNIVIGAKPRKPARFFIQCFDDSINVKSVNTFDSSENAESFYGAFVPAFENAMHVHTNGDVTIAYTRDGIAESNKQNRITSIVLLRVDSNFNQIWKKDVATGYSLATYDLVATQDDGYLVVGTKGIQQPGEPLDIKTDIIVYKVNGNGTITNISELNNPNQNKNVTAYPNPATENISFTNLPAGNFTCTLFNSQGKVVVKSVVQNQSNISVAQLETGIYYYNILNEVGELQFAGKLIRE